MCFQRHILILRGQDQSAFAAYREMSFSCHATAVYGCICVRTSVTSIKPHMWARGSPSQQPLDLVYGDRDLS